MKAWSDRDAQERFGELLQACVTDGPQMVNRRGAEVAVLMSIDEWRRLPTTAQPSLKQSLLSDAARADLPLHARGAVRRRKATPLR